MRSRAAAIRAAVSMNAFHYRWRPHCPILALKTRRNLPASAVSNSAEFDRMQERKNHEKAFGGCTVCIGACGRHRTCAGRCPDRAASTGSGALWPAPASRLGVARRLPTLGWATLRLGSGLLGPAAAPARGVGSCALGPAAPRMGFCSGTLALLNRARNN
jgi:hypothetical protein